MSESQLQKDYGETLAAVTQEVLETMVMSAPDSIRQGLTNGIHGNDEVIAQLGFTGSSNGVYLVSTTRKVACTLCARMLMMEPEELTDEAEIADGFGEICNMIGGGVKNTWVEDGGSMELSIPAVTFGESLHVNFGDGDVVGFAIAAVLPEGELRVDMRIHNHE